MVQQVSDAELEIMKIVWGNPSETTLFPYIMESLAAKGRPCQKNTLIVEQGLPVRQKDRPPQRIQGVGFGSGIPNGADKEVSPQNL